MKERENQEIKSYKWGGERESEKKIEMQLRRRVRKKSRQLFKVKKVRERNKYIMREMQVMKNKQIV